MKYRTMKIVNPKNNECFGVFWLDENNQVDTDNLPPSNEMARLLKALTYTDISIEETNEIIEE